MKAKCIVCGKSFEKRKHNNTCCTPKCAKDHLNSMQKEYREKIKCDKNSKKAKKDEIDISIKKAKELNVSYGEYIAIRDGYLIK